MRNRQIGHAIALAAILVQAPRLVLTLLAADRQPVDISWQRVLLVVAGIGTAVVLTGGNLYLAHTLATATRWRGQLACVWLAVLLSSGSLVVPMIAAGLSGRTLPTVLASGSAAWGWAVLAAVVHEVTAAGCMLAGAVGAAVEPGTEPAASAASASEPAAGSAEPAAASQGSAPEPTLKLVPCRAGCGRSFPSTLAEAGHLRHCPVRQKSLQRSMAK